MVCFVPQKGAQLVRRTLGHQLRRLAVAALAASALTLGLAPALAAIQHSASESITGGALVSMSHSRHTVLVAGSAQPPSDAQCRAALGFPCYSPQEIRDAYNLNTVLSKGFTGKGESIVIVDSFGSPTIAHDLHVFDEGYGLPDPPSFKVLAPLGTVPFNSNDPTMVGWAVETTLDVEWSHAMAPGANIVLMTSPVAETEGVQGMPQFLALEQYALNHHLGQVISQSWGATENTLFTPAGRQVFQDFEQLYAQAAEQHVTVFASSGDFGSANVNIKGAFYPFPTVNFPASSPLVTAVGGTSLFATVTGEYRHETVWNNKTGASGGGISQVFAEPSYQESTLSSSIQSTLDDHRGLPDISYNADPFTSILIFLSFIPGKAGYYAIGGTSEGSPQWAGIIADGDQWAGHPMGFINPALYKIGASHLASQEYHDITVGNNSFAGVTGYRALPGWDLASGWGSPNAEELLQSLIAMGA